MVHIRNSVQRLKPAFLSGSPASKAAVCNKVTTYQAGRLGDLPSRVTGRAFAAWWCFHEAPADGCRADHGFWRTGRRAWGSDQKPNTAELHYRTYCTRAFQAGSTMKQGTQDHTRGSPF